MSVYYKFKSAKDFDSIPIEGQFVSVARLKERIFESKQLGRGTDFDLVVSNAQTDEEYADEAALIPKNTSVLIRRVPGRRRMPIIAEQVESKGVEDKVVELPPPSNTGFGDSSTMRYSEESEYDVFGNDMYAMPEAQPAKPCNPVVDATPVNMVDEDSKIKELIDSSALDWNRPMQDAYGAGRGYGRGMGGRMMGGRGRGFGFGRGGLQGNTPPPGYICHRCKVPGHFIQHCPTNGDPNFDIRRVKPPTGIPRSMLMATPDGSYALPSGAVAVLKPNEAAFEKEIEGLPTSRPVGDLPQELRCPLCKEVMKDAVLTSKCCFRTFCYKCVRDYIITKSMCVCGVANVLVDDLVPNYTLRETISHLLESTSSAENGGSFVQAQDMESARQGQPKLPSPTASATSKDEAGQPSKGYSIDTKEIERTSGENLANAVVNSVDKKAAQNEDPSGATPESASAKEAISPEGAPVADELQDKLLAGDQGKKKKKKKTRVPVSGAAADMQWRGYQDFGTENYTGMPVGPSAFNPYWGGGMPLGMDPYMAPYGGGGMPYMGYAPGPFDVPYGGMLPQDPFAAQGYMMPPGFPQRDLSELGSGNMAMNHGPPIMSREEFEARKADLRRKRDMENLSERDRSRERGDRGRETSNGRDVPPSKAKPLMSQAAPVDRTERAEIEKQRSDRRDRAEKERPVRVERERSARTEKDRAEKDRPVRLDKDRPAPSHDSARHSSPRPAKRKSSSSDREDSAAAAAAAALADRKHKASVFSRISFPGPGEGGNKRKKTEQANGVTAHEANGHREERKPSKGASASSGGRRGGGEEHESSDEEEEEYHFKRRPSRRESADDDARGKKEREHGHGHERSKRR